MLSHPALSGSSANMAAAEIETGWEYGCHTLLFRVLLQMCPYPKVTGKPIWLSHPALSGSSANSVQSNRVKWAYLTSCHTLLFRVLLQIYTDDEDYKRELELSHPALSGSSANSSYGIGTRGGR